MMDERADLDEGSTADLEAIAEGAGLRYVTDAEPGIERRRAGRGFAYRLPDGSRLDDGATRARIDRLAIPPAWTDVWICRSPKGHLQATGRDARGRKQYRYHPTWREVRDADKFDHLLTFGRALPDLRARLDADLRRPGLSRERVLALVVRLLDDTLIRVGNEEYAADNDTYGLTTLRRQHVDVSSRGAHFEFVGKSGVEHDVRVQDAQLARLVRRCHELGGHQLFSYVDDEGQTAVVTSTDVNDHLRDLIGADTSAKDFRTWGGTIIAAETLAGLGPAEDTKLIDANLLLAFDAAAEALRNTRTVCRQSYVHPTIPESYRTGQLLDAWRRARRSGHATRAERMTLSILEAGAAVPALTAIGAAA